MGKPQSLFTIFLVALFWPRQTLANTAIIVLGTPEYVVIGADSKMTTLDGKITRTGCKIRIAQNIVWASALFTKVISNSVNFDVNRIAYESVQHRSSLQEVVADFELRIQPAIIPVIAGIAKSNPVFFNKNIKGGRVLEIVFVGPHDNKLSTFARDVQVEADSDQAHIRLRLHRFDCPTKACPTGGLIRLGTHDAIDSELANNPLIWKDLGVVAATEKLIEIQSSATPNIVGGPISILRITPNGTQWLKNGACQSANEH